MMISKPVLAAALSAVAVLPWSLPSSTPVPDAALAAAQPLPQAGTRIAGLRLTLEPPVGARGAGNGKGTGNGSGNGSGNARAGDAVSRKLADALPAGDNMAAVSADGGARGVVRAVREATLSARLAARVAAMPLAEGDSFKQGELLVAFDCERQAAEARAAAAAVDVQRKNVETNVELDKFESIGKNDLSISKSQLDKASAESDVLKSQIKDCRIVAPFNGRVIERLGRLHEAVAVSQPLLRVVDTSTLELDLIVPSAWLKWLAEGSEFQFRVDETGQSVMGSVARLSPTVDPVSKTIKVVGRLRPGKDMNHMLPGMSGSATFRARG